MYICNVCIVYSVLVCVCAYMRVFNMYAHIHMYICVLCVSTGVLMSTLIVWLSVFKSLMILCTLLIMFVVILHRKFVVNQQTADSRIFLIEQKPFPYLNIHYIVLHIYIHKYMKFIVVSSCNFQYILYLHNNNSSSYIMYCNSYT